MTSTHPVVDKISDELDKQWLDDGMAYERSHGVDWNYKEFSFTTRDESQKGQPAIIDFSVDRQFFTMYPEIIIL